MITISAGHSAKCRGASDIIDEYDENVRVVNQVCSELFDAGIEYDGPFIDTQSTTQNANLNAIVNWHNSHPRENRRDVSVHFNCSDGTTENPIGTECLYYSQQALAGDIATAIAREGGLINRGPKKRTDLFFLNNTTGELGAILIEVCFVNSEMDVELYRENFRSICSAIAETLAAGTNPDLPVTFAGMCSWFGGPEDDGVSPSEDLAWLETWEQVCAAGLQEYFLPAQPAGTSGLARRLDPERFYCACRWDYDVTPKDMLRDSKVKALVRANGKEILAQPIDWGPNSSTGRAADLSPGLLDALGIDTDAQVEVIYPAPAEPAPAEASVDIVITSSGPVRITVNGVAMEEA
jgi:N-acetylmuramoyl-L-alanine amidase